MKLIGAELVSDEVVAVTELVRNAYDADATFVTLAFRDVHGDEAEIIIRDNGHGMDLPTVLECWMQPGASTKRTSAGRYSRGGRRVLGEKGIGRFAADRLGASLELVSREDGAGTEVCATIDWDDFADDERLLSDVRCKWQQRKPQMLQRHGTSLRIGRLRTHWTEKMFRRLVTRLDRMRSPFADPRTFGIFIESEDFPDYSGELDNEFLNQAPYQMDASFDGESQIRLEFAGGDSRELIWQGPGALSCGPIRFRVHAFDLDTSSVARIGPNREVRSWLREWSGVSVYRDGFRVWPYGEPSDDWLRLDQRRVNKPTFRLSNNMVVGMVEISRDGNPDLVDQTNREGFQNNQALGDLRRLLHFMLNQLELERSHRRKPLRRREKGRHEGDEHVGAVARLKEVARDVPKGTRGEISRIAKSLEEAERVRRERIEAIHEGYSELAAVGQVAIGIDASVQEHLASIESALAEMTAGSAEVSRARDSVELVRQHLALLRSLDASNSIGRRAIDLRAEFDRLKTTFSPLLNANGARLHTRVNGQGPLRAEIRPENLARVMYVLLRNSLDWAHPGRDSVVRVTATKTEPRRCRVTWSDNGIGMTEGVADRALEPMFSGREGARGMGLTVAREIIERSAGTIYVERRKKTPGAVIVMELPVKGARATRRRGS